MHLVIGEDMTDTVSAVICVKNGNKTLEKAILSLKNAHIEDIIVIDGESTDGSILIAEQYSTKIWSDEGKGLGHARQLGADKATGRYVLYLDADAELSAPDTVEQLVADLNQFQVSGVQAQLIDPRDHKTYWEEGEDFHRRVHYNKPGIYTHADTIICLLPRDLILRYRFDDYFKGAGAEDTDFFYRAKKEGHRFTVSHAVGYHYHRSSRTDFIKQRIWYGKGNARMIAKHKTPYPLILPLLIFLYGIFLCLVQNRLQYLPFYFVWSLSLFYGTLSIIIH
jgi:glycosyltransferase involved in cell wall biosynthesis